MVIAFTQGWQFCPTLLNPFFPVSFHIGFPRPAKVMGRGWGKILALHHKMGQGWVQNFQTTLPRPSPSLPCPTLLKVIIVNFSYPKTILFKQTYQYQLILFYPMWFFAFILLHCMMRFFFLNLLLLLFFFVIVLLNTWICYSIFSKNLFDLMGYIQL